MNDKPKHTRFTDEVKSYVIRGLENDLSPEQIAGRAKQEGVDCVCYETIYRFVWKKKKEWQIQNS